MLIRKKMCFCFRNLLGNSLILLIWNCMIWYNCIKIRLWKLIWLLKVEYGSNLFSAKLICKYCRFWSHCIKYCWKLNSKECSEENYSNNKNTERQVDHYMKNWLNYTDIWEHLTDSIQILNMFMHISER